MELLFEKCVLKPSKPLLLKLSQVYSSPAHIIQIDKMWFAIPKCQSVL
jgi:hypothetical protein